MKKTKKYIIIITSFIVILLILILNILWIKENFSNNRDNREKKVENLYNLKKIKKAFILNNNRNIINQKENNGLRFEKFRLTQNEVGIFLHIDIKNISGKDIDKSIIKKIVFLNINNEEIGYIKVAIPKMKNNDTIQVYSEIIYDYLETFESEYTKFNALEAVDYKIIDITEKQIN